MDRKIPKPSFSTRRRFKHFCTAFLLGSVSLYAVKSLYELEPETFSKSSVVLNKDTVDIRDFYDNLSYDLKQKGWFYTNPQGKRISLDSISDYRIKDHQVYKNVAGQKYRVTVDTVRVRYPEPAEGKRFPTYHISGADSQNMPSMGSQSWGKVRVREFVVDSTLAPDRQKRLQKIWDNYNDSLNCTEEHEKQHRLNEIAGIMQAGQSFDNKFIECCLDEVSANIRQLLAQRKNYLKRGRSLEQITPRFSFYAELIRNGTVKPRANILTKKEISLIGNGVFDSWMKEKFGMYAARNANRTQNILFKTNVNGIKADPQRHEELLRKMFTIDGHNFYEALEARFAEVKVPEQIQKRFRAIERARTKRMSYLDKLEELRQKEGKGAVNEHLLRNKIAYSLKKGRQ